MRGGRRDRVNDDSAEGDISETREWEEAFEKSGWGAVVTEEMVAVQVLLNYASQQASPLKK